MRSLTVVTVASAIALFASRANAGLGSPLEDAILFDLQARSSGSSSICGGNLQWSNTSSICVDVMSDVKNCGVVDKPCYGGHLTGGKAFCFQGSCLAACEEGYIFDASVDNCVNIADDPHNCGSIGSMCGRPLYGLATCEKGVCGFTCQTGYMIDPLEPSRCARSTPAPPKRRGKKSVSNVYQLCPEIGDTACPIAGSSAISPMLALQLPELTEIDQSILPRDQGGYECIDTTSSVESCGGCSSTGEGVDCTKIPQSMGVGCEDNACVVFSCDSGYQPSLDSTSCIKITPKSGHHGRRKKKNLHHGTHSHDR